jgi:hypothetical protein
VWLLSVLGLEPGVQSSLIVGGTLMLLLAVLA